MASLTYKDIAAHHIVDILGHPQFLARLLVAPEADHGLSEESVPFSVHHDSQVVGDGPPAWRACRTDPPPAVVVENVDCRLAVEEGAWGAFQMERRKF